MWVSTALHVIVKATPFPSFSPLIFGMGNQGETAENLLVVKFSSAVFQINNGKIIPDLEQDSFLLF